MPRIFDCFTFFNELDVLEMRLEELYPVVDKFIITEADQTFRGNPKPFSFDSSDKRWAPYIDKIKLNRYSFLNESFADSWSREIAQRNSMLVGLKECLPTRCDTVIISDVDEIPRRSVVVPVEIEYRLLLDKFSYAINMLTSEGNNAVCMLPYGMFFGRTMEEIRRGGNGDIIENAGWEFSSLGTTEFVYNKLLSFAHTEFDNYISPRILQERIDAGVDILGRDIQHTRVDIDDTWPEAIKNNPKHWRRYVWKPWRL